LSLRYPIPFDHKRALAKILYNFITSEWSLAHLDCLDLASICLTKIIKKKDVHGLCLPWKPFYDTLLKFVDNRDRGSLPLTASPNTVTRCRSSLVSLANKLRFHYPHTTTKELLDLLLPNLDASRDDFDLTQSMLSLFLPVKHGKANIDLWLPRLFETSRWQSSDFSMYLWFKLWARLAKHNIGVLDLSSYLPEIFSRYLQKINLGRGNPNKGSAYRYPIQTLWLLGTKGRPSIDGHMSKLIVYTLHLKMCKHLVSNFFQIAKTSFHPSNAGGHLQPLSTLLSGLGTYYGRRIGRERMKKSQYSAELNLQTADDYIVDTLLPITKLAMYSKSHRMIAATQSFLRNVASVHPQRVFPVLLDEWIPALKNTTQSHRTMSALSCLGWLGDTLLNRKINPPGCTSLESILWLSLPGIDPVDLMKTGKTLMMYTLIFYTVPLIDAKEYKGKAAQGAEFDDESQRATMCLPEWCPQFLDRVLLVIRQQEGFEKQNPLDQATYHLIHRCVRAFFSSLSDSLAKLCIKHIAKHVLGSDFWPVSKYTGSLLSSVGLTQPLESLNVMIPLLSSKLITESKKSEDTKKDSNRKAMYTEDGKWWKAADGGSVSERQHCLYLFSQLVKQSGSATIRHLPIIRAIYTVFKDSEDTKIRNFSGRILRNTLRALTRVYPTEYKGHTPGKWNEASWAHWQEWGSHEDINNLEISWHLPSKLELQHAAALCEFALIPAVKMMETFELNSSAQDKKDSEDTLQNALEQVMNVQRGANAVLGEFSDALSENLESDYSKHTFKPSLESRSQLLCVQQSNNTIFYSLVDNVPEGCSSLRTYISSKLNQLADKLVEGKSVMLPRKKRRIDGENVPSIKENDSNMLVETKASSSCNVKVMETLSECLSLSLNLWLINNAKLVSNFHHKLTSRRSRRDNWSTKKCTLRTLNLEWSYYLHLLRSDFELENNRRYTVQVNRTVCSLLKLSQNDFKKVRDSAAKGLHHTFRRYPESKAFVLGSLMATIESPKSSKEEILGALKVFSHRDLLQTVCLNYDNMMLVVNGLFSGTCEGHQDEKVQTATHGAFLLILSTFEAPEVPFSLDGNSSKVTELKQESQKQRQKLQNTLNRIIAILSGIHGSAKHWRYQLVATSMLVEMMLCTRSFPQNAVQLLTEGMLSDLFALRQICIRGLTAIFTYASVYSTVPVCAIVPSFLTKDTKRPINMCEIKDTPDWNGSNEISEGATRFDVHRFRKYDIDQQSIQKVGTFISRNSEKLFKVLQENHPKLAPNSGTRKREGAATDILNTFISRTSYLHSSVSEPDGVRESAFDTTHVQLFVHLFNAFPDFVKVAIGIVRKLVKSEEKEQQCLSAEVVAAICEFAVSGPFERASILKESLPIVKEMLQNGTQDTVAMWCDAVSCAINSTKERPRRLAPIISTIAEEPFKAGGVSNIGSAESFRYLRLLRTILDDCSWRTLDVGLWTIDKLEELKLLAHPYKQIRSEVGNILSSVTRSSFQRNSRGYQRLQTLVQSLSEQLEPILTNKSGERGQEEEKRLVSMANIAIQWMIPCSYFSETFIFKDLLFPLLPAVFHMQHTTDTEAANRAKFCARSWAWGSWNFDLDEGSKVAANPVFNELLKTLRKLSKDSNWHVRKAVTEFLSVFIPRHAFLLSGGGSIENEPHPSLKTAKSTLINLLSDTQVEVREGSAKALQALLSSVPGSGGDSKNMSKMTNKMYKKLFRMSRTKIPGFSKDEKAKEQRTIAINTRHGGLLGLSAFILSQPYDVPEWLPSTICGLAEHTRDTIPISTTAKKLFQEFMRTHQDEWHLFEDKFSEEQLDTLRDCGSSLSYFA